MQKYKVIFQTSHRDYPEAHEISAAILVAEHFKKNVVFLRRESKKTADLKVGVEFWELKAPTGSSRNTIRNNLNEAKRQSGNIILDLRRIKLHQNKAMAHLRHYVAQGHRSVKHIKIITKDNKIIDVC